MSDPFDRLAVPPQEAGVAAVTEVYGQPPESEIQDAADTEDQPAPPKFDQRHRLPCEGLLFLGALIDEFVWAGHSFRIRTLHSGDILQVALQHARFMNTLGDVKAYQVAVVAACLISYDGKPMPIPLVDDPALSMQERWDHVLPWYPPTHDAIYSRYLELERQQREVLDAMGKASG